MMPGFGVASADQPQHGLRKPFGQDHTYDVYCAKIPVETTEDELMEIFSPVGDVKGIRMMPPRGENTMKIAFIKYGNEEDALCAAKYINNCKIRESILHVNYRKKEQGDSNDGSSDGGNESGPAQGFNRQTSGEKRGGGRDSKRGRGSPRGGFGNRGGGFPKYNSFVDESSRFSNDDDFSKNGWDNGQNFDTPSNEKESRENKPDLSSVVTKQIEEIKALVVHVESPVTFWSQAIVTENAEELQRITEELQSECPSMHPVIGQLTAGQVYGSKFSVDQQWYRCKVDKHMPELGNKIQVRYIDYGNCEIVEQGSLVGLPKLLASYTPCAQVYQLAGTVPVNVDPNSELFLKGTQKLSSLIQEEVVYVKIVEAGDIPKVTIDVVKDGHKVDVIQEMVKAAVVTKTQLPSDLKPLMDVKLDATTEVKKSMAARFPANKVSANNKTNTSNDVENQQLKHEIEASKGEVEKLKRKNNLLEKEFHESLKTAAHFKFSKLISKVKMLKDFRANVQIDEGLPVSLQLAIDLTLDENKSIKLSKMSQYQELLTGKEDYLKFQDNLKDHQNKESLGDLAEDRDKARIVLVDKINSFVDYSDMLPMASRHKELENAVREMRKRYVQPLGNTELSVKEAVDAYEEWRVSKISEIKDIQSPTNQFSAALSSTFEGLQQRINIFAETLIVLAVDTEIENVDELCANYEYAIATEISKMKQANIDADAKQKLDQIVHSVFTEINNEIEDISRLRNGLQEGYIKEKDEIQQWLMRRPDVSKLQTIRKAWKKLKLNFKHKQVDREALEEGDDAEDKKNLENIEKELFQIRLDLQGVLVEENKQMSELARITERHFPELPTQYPDIGMTTFLETEGLVQARELEHYSHHAMPVISVPKKRPVVFKTSFDQRPCVIKKYSLDEKCHKECLKSRMISYKKCRHDHLLPLDALFFDKSEREAYLQTPFYEEGNFQQFIKSSPSDEDIRNVLKDVVNSLACLHSNGFIHGSIKPENILIERKDGKLRGILAEPNFEEDYIERFQALSQYSASSTYPTLQLGSENTSPSLDVFCLGLCTLWAYIPETVYPDDWIRNIDSLLKDCDGSLKDFLDCLLTRVPSLRISVQDAAMHAFFEMGIYTENEAGTISRDSSSPSEELINAMKDVMENSVVAEETEPTQEQEEQKDLENKEVEETESEEISDQQ